RAEASCYRAAFGPPRSRCREGSEAYSGCSAVRSARLVSRRYSAAASRPKAELDDVVDVEALRRELRRLRAEAGASGEETGPRAAQWPPGAGVGGDASEVPAGDLHVIVMGVVSPCVPPTRSAEVSCTGDSSSRPYQHCRRAARRRGASASGAL